MAFAKEIDSSMFPNPYGDFQMFTQMQAFREVNEMFKEAKRARRMGDSQVDLLPLKRRFWFCLGLIGGGLSKLGRNIEGVGQRLTWYALHKKAENAPDYYR
jgi:hypothetical protein